MSHVVAAARRLWSVMSAGCRGARDFLLRREEGASIVEYVFPVALIALICIAAMQFLGGGLSNFFHKVADKLNSLVP